MEKNDEIVLDDQKVNNMVKKAKRKTLIKQVLISIIVTLILVPVILIGILQLTYRGADNMSRDIGMVDQITRPNYKLLGDVTRRNLFGGEVEYDAYKIIEGTPILWGKEVYEYSFRNSFSRIDDRNPFEFGEEDASTRHFYHGDTLQREMQFYHPKGKYTGYLNDVSLLEGHPDKVAEMAISFNKSYTVQDIKKMLPDQITPVWYWVDTNENLKNLEDMPEVAHYVYGFDAEPGYIEYGDGTEKDFILAVESGMKMKGKYKNEYKRIYDFLRKEKKEPSPDDVKVIGVVVTGTTENLKNLSDQPYAKAIVLGAVVDRK
ncbi:anti sigma factor C-terminal domain-containing protein [Peribacillus sp. NPDC096447]|uniref:anti sigma factor C-terminal domain-containing protein n=1 Tax=Peribacillus sp. NPDC096447 TaxID=3364394 RepID=UPI003805CC89